jgi:hypothetical protein
MSVWYWIYLSLGRPDYFPTVFALPFLFKTPMYNSNICSFFFFGVWRRVAGGHDAYGNWWANMKCAGFILLLLLYPLLYVFLFLDSDWDWWVLRGRQVFGLDLAGR